jgi:hypothetical protein
LQAIFRSEEAAEAAIKIDMEQANPPRTRADYEVHELEVRR